MIVLLAGVGGGLGKAIAKSLLENNIEVVAVSRSASALESHPNLITIDADLGIKEEVKNALFKIKDMQIDIIIWNSAAGRIAPLIGNDSAEWEDWAYGFRVDTISQIEAIKIFVPGMISRDAGQIIDITSLGAHYPFRNASGYATAKAANSYLMKLLQIEIPEIRATEICLGNVRYGHNENMPTSIELSDVTNMILYLIKSPKHLRIPRIDLVHIHQKI